MKWLFVTAEFPYPLDHGTYLRVYHLARTLRQTGDEVSVLAPTGDDEAVRAYASIRVTALSGGPAETSTAYRGAHPTHDALGRAVADHAGDFDIVVLTHARTLQYAPAATGGCIIADLIDDLILEERRKLWTDLHPLRWIRRVQFLRAQRRYELEHVGRIGLATFVSEADASTFSSRHPSIQTAVIPNGVDADYFAAPAESATDEGRPTVLFLGRFSHPPNADAARYLLGAIAPRIRQKDPEVSIVILGSDPPGDLAGLVGPNDRITGRVDDIRPDLQAATVVVLPMRLGTGIKNKLLEAWAAGRAVVATSLACQGAPVEVGENLLCADGADALADATVRLLRDAHLREHLGRRGRQTVIESLSWEAAAEKLRRRARLLMGR